MVCEGGVCEGDLWSKVWVTRGVILGEGFGVNVVYSVVVSLGVGMVLGWGVLVECSLVVSKGDGG